MAALRKRFVRDQSLIYRGWDLTGAKESAYTARLNQLTFSGQNSTVMAERRDHPGKASANLLVSATCLRDRRAAMAGSRLRSKVDSTCMLSLEARVCIQFDKHHWAPDAIADLKRRAGRWPESQSLVAILTMSSWHDDHPCNDHDNLTRRCPKLGVMQTNGLRLHLPSAKEAMLEREHVCTPVVGLVGTRLARLWSPLKLPVAGQVLRKSQKHGVTPLKSSYLSGSEFT